MKILLTTIFVILLWGTPFPPQGCGGAGLKPLKPLPPLGCKDVQAQCVCDAYGQHCHWEWVCVK